MGRQSPTRHRRKGLEEVTKDARYRRLSQTRKSHLLNDSVGDYDDPAAASAVSDDLGANVRQRRSEFCPKLLENLPLRQSLGKDHPIVL